MFASVLTVLLAAPSGAAGALPIPARELLPRRADLPGFGLARERLEGSSSPFTWARDGGATRSEARQEASELQTLGFEEAASASFTVGRARHGVHRREAVAETIVLANPAGARTLLAKVVAGVLPSFSREGVHPASDPAVPGSVELTAFARRGGGFDNVFFTSGRCMLVVADSLHDASSPAAVERAPRDAAVALGRRVGSGVCRPAS
jgi:hypothetical protein